MADVTISALTPGTPAGSALVPYSTGTVTLGTPVSAMFHNAGNIGIGTASLSARLHVYNTSDVTLVLDKPTGASVEFHNSTGRSFQIDEFAGALRFMNKDLIVKMTIDQNGNMINNNLPMYGVRAWVKFSGINGVNGSVSTANTDRQIFASGNVTRVTRTSLGNYDIYLTTPFANTNYSAVANIKHAIGYTTAVHIDADALTAGIVRTWCSYQPSTVSYDPVYVDVWVIG